MALERRQAGCNWVNASMAVSREPLGVLLVELVAADQAVGGAIPGITVVIVAEQAVMSPSRRAPPARVMLSMSRVLEDGDQDGETGGTRSAVRPPALELQLIESAAGDG